MPAPESAAALPAAVLVSYRRQHEVPAMLGELCALLPAVLLVDNGEQPDGDLQAQAQALGAHYLHNANRGGLAGAYNLALQHLQQLPQPSHTAAPQHLLFLDEDSDTRALRAFLLDEQTQQQLAQPQTAALSPAYRDRATGLRGRYMWLQRWRLGFFPREFEGLREVAFVINSMSVWRLAALQRIGAFNEGLAVDHVDTEYCLRARAAGLQVLVHGSHEFDHAIGQRRRYRFLGMEVQSGGHGPQRRQMIGRNTMHLATRWCWREPAFAALCLMRLSYEAIGIVLAEDRAWPKLWALASGAAHGLLLPLPRPRRRPHGPHSAP